jgi:uncharacterized protein (TIGR02172 family)
MKELSSTPIAQGRTAEIFLWGDNEVLKLYRDWCPSDWIDYEQKIAHAVHEAGIPTPAPGEIVDVNGRRGLVYERLEGISMLRDMNARPWTILKHARSLAELQVEINQKSIPGLPSVKDGLRNGISTSRHLRDDQKEKILTLLDTLPEGKSLCHGDYHPDNVFLIKSGPVIIDWVTSSRGSPWADVARTSMILEVAPKAVGKQVSTMVLMMIQLYRRMYLNRYQKIVPDEDNEGERWLPIIAAARLNEEIVLEREALLKIVERTQ